MVKRAWLGHLFGACVAAVLTLGGAAVVGAQLPQRIADTALSSTTSAPPPGRPAVVVMGTVPGILQHPAPFVLQTKLRDYHRAYELNAYTNPPNRLAAPYTPLHSAIQDRFNEAGVEIMSPAFTSLRDGNASTIPPPHTPPAHATPAFRFVDVLRSNGGAAPVDGSPR